MYTNEQLIEFCQEAVRIPSYSGQEKGVAEFMKRKMEEYGFDEVIIDKYGSVLGTINGKRPGKTILMDGHIDTVDVIDAPQWKHDPFGGEIVDGRIYGRGTSDMKSGAAAMTMAIRAIQACGIRLKGDLIVEYVMDEELTGNGTLACVMKGYKADAGICCETSSMCVQPGSIGRIWFTINVKGKAAGIQKHREGVSGIDLGYLVCKAVEEYEALRMSKISHPLYPDIPSSIPCAIGQFDSGTYNSAFPDSCVLKGSMATVPGEDSKAARLLRLPPNAGSAFVIGMTGGYPAGAQAVGLLYERGELSRDEAEHALAVCNQAGPSFIFGFLGGAVFAHPGAGALLCGVQLLAAVLTCRLTAKPNDFLDCPR